MAPLQFRAQRASNTFRFAALFSGFLLACTLAATISTNEANASPTALLASHSAPPAGLSVEPKEAPFNKGFDFKFKSGTSSATVSIDPLGTRHSDTATISATGYTYAVGELTWSTMTSRVLAFRPPAKASARPNPPAGWRTAAPTGWNWRLAGAPCRSSGINSAM